MLNDAVESALNDGFGGLRTCGDMSWLLGEPSAGNQVAEYEAILNEFFKNVRGLEMCQYDRRRIPPALLHSAGVIAHSTAIVDGVHKHNRFFDPRPQVTPLSDEEVLLTIEALRQS
jgi:hypothetical protein